jgi:hypothetical protein
MILPYSCMTKIKKEIERSDILITKNIQKSEVYGLPVYLPMDCVAPPTALRMTDAMP